MALPVTIPISTEVIENNPDCKIEGRYEKGRVVITVDTRHQNHYQRLGLSTHTKLHWGDESTYEVQELSGFSGPIRYVVQARQGYYLDGQRQRVHFTTQATGIDPRRKVSAVLMRAAVLLVVIAGAGYRKTSWLLDQLFHVEVSKSSLQRWVDEVAAQLPDGDEIIRRLNAKQAIHEAHFDEWFPKGVKDCVLVVRDEHGRIIATQAVDQKDEESVKPFLQRLQRLGLKLNAFYIDGCQAYYNAIRAVFGQTVQIQYDYFHIIQNAWRHLWKWAVAHRRQLKKRSEKATTPWYKKKLEALATTLWENRYLLFKADQRLSDDEKKRLTQILEADEKVSLLRAFLGGVWHIFEDSQDAQEARAALDALKQQPIDQKHREPFDKVVAFLKTHFDWMTAFLRHEKVKRNSLAETGMRTLRRLEGEHDGFRSEKGRDHMIRIYQAVQYLGWSVHRPPPDLLDST